MQQVAGHIKQLRATIFYSNLSHFITVPVGDLAQGNNSNMQLL